MDLFNAAAVPRRMRAGNDFSCGIRLICPTGNFMKMLSSPSRKNILIFRNGNLRYISCRPASL
jgi:hypothetical protein